MCVLGRDILFACVYLYGRSRGCPSAELVNGQGLLITCRKNVANPPAVALDVAVRREVAGSAGAGLNWIAASARMDALLNLDDGITSLDSAADSHFRLRPAPLTLPDDASR